jgi:two-component system, cell cycle response regulator
MMGCLPSAFLDGWRCRVGSTKILIAEDDPIARCILETTLRKHQYEVTSVTDGQTAWKLLSQPDAPRLAILDWMMPGMDGVEICRALRAGSSEPYVYVLMLTAKGRRQDVIEGLEAGADDYLVKPFDHYELHARLTVGKRILELQNRYLEACDDLRMQAARDSLTNLWNHAAIFDRLEQEIVRAQRQCQPLGVLMADLDYFKRINDTHGHATGDTVLRDVANGYCNLTRPYDSVGRYGGEEFMFVLPGCDAEATKCLAERLREEVSRLRFTPDLIVTVSIGATSFSGREPITASALVKHADDALYQAKNAGRNRVEFKDSTGQTEGRSAPYTDFLPALACS